MPRLRLPARALCASAALLLLAACTPAMPGVAVLPTVQSAEGAPVPPVFGLPVPLTSVEALAPLGDAAQGALEEANDAAAVADEEPVADEPAENGAAAPEEALAAGGEAGAPFEPVVSGESAVAAAANAVAGEGDSLRYYAPVVPFDTIQDDISLAELETRWQGGGTVYSSEDGLALLPSLLGEPAEATTAVDPEDLIGLLEEDRTAIGIIPFEQIDPRFKVLTVDGTNVLSNQLQPGDYTLAVDLNSIDTARVDPEVAFPNRDPGRLTTLVMTGVTAMARGTADAIERAGDYAYPARVIGPELAQADITHVSNEIPFIEGCEVWNFENNLTLCSKPEYWAALELMGTDIVGLSGNHVNDFGRDGARESLTWYKENNIPIYGSGFTVDEACAPLLWSHDGNTFAFIAALAFDPESAWVTDTEPGACYYYEHKDRIISTIETLSKAVDIVAVELQYEETYFASPTPAQVEEFRALRAAGADLVTGVQSHVPQAQEGYGQFDEGGRGMISYGLGNLYFDQMWSWETRAELYARHTIYDGQIISTEILTGMLEDFAQPRWATPDERAEILEYIFDGTPARP